MADKWITVKPNGSQNKGQPALIGEGGVIKGGMGGKFNGEKISEVRKDFTGAKTPRGGVKPEPKKESRMAKHIENMQKAATMKKQSASKPTSSQKMSFEDYVSDFGDVDVDLLSPRERVEWRKAYESDSSGSGQSQVKENNEFLEKNKVIRDKYKAEHQINAMHDKADRDIVRYAGSKDIVSDWNDIRKELDSLSFEKVSQAMLDEVQDMIIAVSKKQQAYAERLRERGERLPDVPFSQRPMTTQKKESPKSYREKTGRSGDIYLNVPYAEKDKAKRAGAKWNPDAKKWYIPSNKAVSKGMEKYIAQDRDAVAMDKASARRFDDNGHLLVDSTTISKAAVNDYYGSEIPNHKGLGLVPEKIYRLLRDPEELERGMGTFAEKQLLLKHIFVSAEEPQKEFIAGTIGSNVSMDGDKVKASLTVWDKDAINLIESGKLAELSASYFYDADMTPGTWNGQAYDGIMRNIRANHVALVERGRIGADAVVADALPKLMELNMKLKKGALAKINAKAKELLAMDADIPNEVLKEIIEEVVENTEHIVDDEELSEVEKIVGAEDEEDEQTQAERDNESEAMRLKEREEREREDRERDIRAAEDSAVVRVTQLFEAREIVKPLVGVVAFDSAVDVYKHALSKHGKKVSTTNIDDLKTMVGMLVEQKSQPHARTAMDSATYEEYSLTKRFR